MKPRLWLSLAAAALPALVLAQAPGKVSKSDDRTKTLRRAEFLLSDKAPPAGIADLKDPCNPTENDLKEDYDPNQGQKLPVGPVAPPPDLIRTLAALLKPTGSVSFGGELYLQFGEKRQKIGDKMRIAYEGVDYVLEITNIEANRFWLRYNDQEIARSIK